MRPRGITTDDLAKRIDEVRNINREIGYNSIFARENVVRQKLGELADIVSATPWDIRPAVLSTRSSHEVAAELEALTHV